MTRRKTTEPAAFSFAAFLYLLERTLPKRSKARRLIPELEAFVGDLKRAAVRPWEVCNVDNGIERGEAQTALFESIMRIDPRYRFDVGVNPAMQASQLSNVPDSVVREVQKLLERERAFGYIEQFVSLRLKGEVVLADKRTPVEGSIYAKLAERRQ